MRVGHAKTCWIWETAWGEMAAAVSGKGLCHVSLPHQNAECLREDLQAMFPRAAWSDQRFARLMQLTDDYFTGTRADFSSLQLDMTFLTPFSNCVLAACRRIQYGRTSSYGQLARHIRRPTAARAVSQALGSNPVPLVIPCHRVIASDDTLGGFSASGGVDLKRRMLQLERRVCRL